MTSRIWANKAKVSGIFKRSVQISVDVMYVTSAEYQRFVTNPINK